MKVWVNYRAGGDGDYCGEATLLGDVEPDKLSAFGSEGEALVYCQVPGDDARSVFPAKCVKEVE